MFGRIIKDPFLSSKDTNATIAGIIAFQSYTMELLQIKPCWLKGLVDISIGAADGFGLRDI